jgi:hypothetical protein
MLSEEYIQLNCLLRVRLISNKKIKNQRKATLFPQNFKKDFTGFLFFFVLFFIFCSYIFLFLFFYNSPPFSSFSSFFCLSPLSPLVYYGSFPTIFFVCCNSLYLFFLKKTKTSLYYYSFFLIPQTQDPLILFTVSTPFLSFFSLIGQMDEKQILLINQEEQPLFKFHFRK